MAIQTVASHWEPDLEETDILLTVAEIGVALAGFASLAAVVGRRYKNVDPVVNAMRLRGLLDAGLSTMLLALIAVLLLQIGKESIWVWRVSSAAGLFFVIPIGGAALRREKLRRHLPGYRRPVAAVMFLFVGLAALGFALTAAGLAGDFGFHVYLGILCLLLAICCTMFVLVIASLLSSEPAPDSQSGPDAGSAD